jgi:deoxyadenosine/deoxycytidine kinase
MSPGSLRHICILGNIGSGKSTLVERLARDIPDSIAIPESFEHNPFLALYMQEPRRWAFTNAVRYYYDYARTFHEMTAGRNYAHAFIDAGGATNRYIYGRYLAAQGIVIPAENELYIALCESLARDLRYPEPDAYLFVKASPEACFRRMLARGWAYQTRNIRIDYLVALAGYFESLQSELRAARVPLLELDSVELDFTADVGGAEAVRRVRAFLDAHE